MASCRASTELLIVVQAPRVGSRHMQVQDGPGLVNQASGKARGSAPFIVLPHLVGAHS